MVRRSLVGLACGILLGSVLSGPAVAAQQGSSEHSSRTDLDEIRKVSALLKTEVLNRANEKIATVSDLMLTPDGKVHYAILGVGGVVGIGTKYTAIPWSKLETKHLNGRWAANLDMTKDRLDQAPMLQDENYNELNNPQWIGRVREFFGANVPGSTAHEPSGESTSGAAQQKMLRASKILHATLKNPRDESLGSVEDLLLEKGSRVAFAIIGHGGVLGIGESYIPVPWSKLRFTHRPDSTSLVAVLDMNRDQLEKAPLVKGSTYETMLAPGFTDQVCRFFGVAGRE
jgi:sporulation protein YlmC with PRC-barrel domain